MEKEIYYTRVLPLVRYIVKKDKNGKEYTDVIDNLSREERLSLSEEKLSALGVVESASIGAPFRPISSFGSR